MDGDEAIAIVGIACRFPGANSQEEFWKLLKNGEDHVIPIPGDRWNTDVYYDSDPDKCGKTYTRFAGIINDVDAWDNNFFGVSDEEASVMDPQQSMAIECTYMALEDAGITKREISGSNTGVYIGVMNNDYHVEVMNGAQEKNMFSSYTLTGTPQSIVAARVSYVYNLFGPAMAVDTACSSSLVAIHQGASAIRSGDCTAAICGGVTYILAPEVTIGMSRTRISSRTGKCHTFSANADGYVRGEGCGIVILKRLIDAKRDGNKIWGTVVSGCNQDGHTAAPITAPSGQQQLALLRHVYNRFNIDPSVVQFIEAHGTGTPRGDPTEVNSLAQNFSPNERERDIYIGSVKTNIGHLEAASGVAGLIKILLMVKHSTIVQNLHYDPPNPKINFDGYKFKVPKACIYWTPDKLGRRIACVNSFGFGGTNAHAVIECSPVNNHHTYVEGKTCLVTISSPTKSSLLSSVRDFLERIKDGEYNIDDISFTSVKKRNHYPYRLAFVARSLSDIDTDQLISKVHSTEHSHAQAHHVIFICCGVGTCWKGMCKKLISRFSVFRSKLTQIDTCLSKYCNVSMVDSFETGSDFTDPFLSHLSIFASQVCLAAQWLHWGVVPSCVIGQSVGEVAASVISGALSLEDGVAVIYYRSKYLAEVTDGKMVVCLGVPTAKVEKLCQNIDDASIAVYISGRACTVSGSAVGIANFKKSAAEKFTNNGLHVRDLPVSCAYHTNHVANAADSVLNALDINANKTHIPMYSTVTGSRLEEDVDPKYWYKNMIEPVLFQQAVENSLHDTKKNVFIEIGPRPVLSAHINDIFPSPSPTVVPSLVRDNDETCLLESLGALYMMGFHLNWNSLPCSGQTVDVPRTVFERQKLLKLPALSKKKRATGELFKLSHMFMNETAIRDVYEIQFSTETVPFAYEHSVLNHLVLPGATFVEAAIVVGKFVYNSHFKCRVKFDKLLFLEKDDILSMITETSEMNTGYTFQIEKEGTVYAHGQIRKTETPNIISYDIDKLRSLCTQHVDQTEIYSRLKQAGFIHGPTLQLLQYGLIGENISFAEVRLNDHVLTYLDKTILHPCILDSCLQTTIFSYQQLGNFNGGIPYAIGTIQHFSAITDTMYIVCYLREVSETRTKHDILLLNDEGGLVVQIKDYTTKFTGNSIVATSVKHSIEWNKLADVQTYKRESNSDETIKTVILTSTNRLFQLHKMVNRPSSMVLNMQSLIEEDGETFQYQRFIKEIKSRWQKVDSVDAIVYQPGIELEGLTASSVDVLDKVADQCYSLIVLLRTLKQNTLRIPVIVMTANAVNVSRDDICDPVTASLWGQVRCLRLEVGAQSLPLILDTCTNDNYINCCTLDFKQLFRDGWIECAIRGESLYANQIKAIDDSDQRPAYREIELEPPCDAVLKTSTVNTVDDPHLIYRNPAPIHSVADGFVRILVKLACLHKPILYPPTETTILDQQGMNKSFYNEGHGVLTFELVGNVLSNAQEEVAVCYPLMVGCYVDVPKVCIIHTDNKPWYQPGMLTKMSLILGLVNCLEPKTCVSILVDEDDKDINQLISMVLKKKRVGSYNIVTRTDLTCKRFSIYSTLLCFVPLSKRICVLLLDQWKTPKRIVSLNSFLDGTNAFVLSKKHRTFDMVSKSVDELLNGQSCERLVPIIKRILKKYVKENGKKTSERLRVSENASDRSSTGIISPRSVLHMNVIKSGAGGDLTLDTVRVSEEKLFRKDGCYIVVGGLSGLGLEVIKLLASKSAGNIVSVSRRKPNDSQQHVFKQISKRHNCFVTSVSADINDLNSVYNMVHTISKLLPSIPIKGIFHGAAVEADEHIFTISRAKFEYGLRPKVQGTWNLHVVSGTLPLDYFVVHSSITALVGNITQSNYGAGCTFQNATINYRRKHGLPGQTINWGGINTGLAVGDENKMNVLKHHGVSLMELDVAQKCLMDSLMHNHEEVAYCDINWTQLSKTQKQNADIPIEKFKKLVNVTQNGMLKTPKQFLGSNANESVSALMNELSDILAKSIPVDVNILTPETNLIDLGMDSMASLALTNKLNSELNVTVPLALILSPNISIHSLACFVIEAQAGGAETQGANPDRVEITENTHF